MEYYARWIKNEPNPEKLEAFKKLGWAKAMSSKSIYWTCSRCDGWGTPSYNYCPHCGSKMSEQNVQREPNDMVGLPPEDSWGW